MTNTFWYKQDSKPLFAELEWNKPERRDHAGKICLLGGNVHSLTAPAKAYDVIKQTGPSSVKIVLPDKAKRLMSSILPEAQYLPSTSSGEFSQLGQTELEEILAWADTLLLPGDTGRNSETSILLETIVRSYAMQIVVTRDSLDSLMTNAGLLTDRPQTTLVLSFAQLQRLIKTLGRPQALLFSIDLVKLVDLLHEFTQHHAISIATVHHGQLLVAANGRVSSTKLGVLEESDLAWRTTYASIASSYQTWYPAQPFKALTQAAFIFKAHV